MTIEESQAKGLWSRLRVLLGVRDSHHGLSEVDELGIRIPPARLRYDVAGTNDLEWFLEGGRLGLETLVSTPEKEKLDMAWFQSKNGKRKMEHGKLVPADSARFFPFSISVAAAAEYCGIYLIILKRNCMGPILVARGSPGLIAI